MAAALTNPSGRMTLGSSVVRIGSAQDNHVVINDPKVSPRHAEIRPDGHGEYSHVIADLGSMTGTFVNERRLDLNVPSWLRPNDTIRIGDAIFKYEVTGASEADETERIARSSVNQPTPQERLQRPPAQYSAPAAPPYSVRDESGSGEGTESRSAFAPPPTGGIAPVSPLGSAPPAYTGAARELIGAPQAPVLGPRLLLQKENRGKLWLAGGLTVLVILLVAFLFGSFHSPGRTLDTFCSALQNGDYQTAYNQLSPGLQGISTESQFALLAKSRRITSCTHSSPNVSGNSAVATIITNSGPSSTVWLIQDSSFNWKIDSLSGL